MAVRDAEMSAARPLTTRKPAKIAASRSRRPMDTRSASAAPGIGFLGASTAGESMVASNPVTAGAIAISGPRRSDACRRRSPRSSLDEARVASAAGRCSRPTQASRKSRPRPIVFSPRNQAFFRSDALHDADDATLLMPEHRTRKATYVTDAEAPPLIRARPVVRGVQASPLTSTSVWRRAALRVHRRAWRRTPLARGHCCSLPS